MSSLCLALALAPCFVRAHDHTARAFQQERAAAQARAARQTEPAPRADGASRVCRLTLELTTGDPARRVAGLVRITNLATGKWLSFENEIPRDLGWFALGRKTTLLVPPTPVKLEAFHGLTSELAVRELDLSGRESASVELPLIPFYDPAARGLRSGNTHLHLMRMTHSEAVRYLDVVPSADGLELVFLSHLRREPEDREYISNRFRGEDLAALSRGAVRFGNGEEHRHNFGAGGEGFGHVMFLDIRRLIEPVSIGPGIMKKGTDGIPLQRGIRQARAQGATVIWCHNKFGYEDLPNWVSGLLHAQNIFDGGSEGDYADTFYRYLDLGLRVPFSTGTDWFIYDFARVYVSLAGELSPRSWLEKLAAGRSFITNGVFLELDVDGRGVGDTLAVRAGQELRVAGRGIGRNDFARLELVHNGHVVHAEKTAAEAGHFTARLEQRLRVVEPGWIALRIPDGGGQSELGKPLFAHTSPVYVEVDGRRRFVPEVARGIVAEIEQSASRIAARGSFAGAAERESVLRVYREAVTSLERRIQAGR